MAWMGWVRSLAGWALGLLGVLASAGLSAALAYWVLLALGLQPREAATVAFPIGPAFVVAFFTVALWRSTQSQAEATRAMQELQRRIVSADLAPLLGVRIVKEFSESVEGKSWQLEISNLGKYGVLLVAAYWLESCSSGSVEQRPVKQLGFRSVFPVALPSGKTAKVLELNFLDGLLKEREAGELGCLALSLLYGGEPLLRCYTATKVEDAVIRVVFDFPDPREIFKGVKERVGDAQQMDHEYEIIVHGAVLKECECPRELEVFKGFALSN